MDDQGIVKKYLNGEQSCKLSVRIAIIDKHRNAKCNLWKRTFTLIPLVPKTITVPSSFVIWWNYAKLYKMKAPKERERKRNKGQAPKSRQASSPNKVILFRLRCHCLCANTKHNIFWIFFCCGLNSNLLHFCWRYLIGVIYYLFWRII
jgi:hypothetical protein